MGKEVITLPSSTTVTGNVEITNDSGNAIPVSGTFWQSTQPVSLTSVPTHGVTLDTSANTVKIDSSNNTVKITDGTDTLAIDSSGNIGVTVTSMPTLSTYIAKETWKVATFQISPSTANASYAILAAVSGKKFRVYELTMSIIAPSVAAIIDIECNAVEIAKFRIFANTNDVRNISYGLNGVLTDAANQAITISSTQSITNAIIGNIIYSEE